MEYVGKPIELGYTVAKAREEVGDSTSLHTGIISSAKKWGAIDRGEGTYTRGAECGICIVAENLAKTLSGEMRSSILAGRHESKTIDPIVKRLKQYVCHSMVPAGPCPYHPTGMCRIVTDVSPRYMLESFQEESFLADVKIVEVLIETLQAIEASEEPRRVEKVEEKGEIYFTTQGGLIPEGKKGIILDLRDNGSGNVDLIVRLPNGESYPCGCLLSFYREEDPNEARVFRCGLVNESIGLPLDNRRIIIRD